jgi:hypothetical protein
MATDLRIPPFLARIHGENGRPLANTARSTADLILMDLGRTAIDEDLQVTRRHAPPKMEESQQKRFGHLWGRIHIRKRAARGG